MERPIASVRVTPPVRAAPLLLTLIVLPAMRPLAAPVALRLALAPSRFLSAWGRPFAAIVAAVLATLVASAATVSLPLTTGETAPLNAGTFAGGTLVRIGVTGTGDLVDSRLQVNPDGSLLAASSSPYTFFNTGQPYPAVSGFPAGDGVNRFIGHGANFDYNGSVWMFAGKQTTDTTDPATIRAGAVVGSFSATPTRADWFQIGYGRTIRIPSGGATLYLAVNDSFSPDNHGTYTVTTTPLTWDPVTEYSTANGNPNGVWRYGFMDPGFTTLTLYTNFGSHPSGYRNWYGAYGDQTPSVGHTGPTSPLNSVPPAYVLLHPGQAQEPSILRWTAPLAATIRVVGSFHAGDQGVMQVAIRRGSNVLWTATDAGSFDLTLTVALGDTLDFTAFGGYAYGSTGLLLNISAATASLPLTVSDGNKVALGAFPGGTSLQLAVTGTGDIANGAWPTNPDGSLAGTASGSYAFANAGSAFAPVAGFPAGDGVNRFVGGGAHYDYAGTGWPFAGKQTTDTTDPAAIRFGAVVGTFAASPTRADWFLIGTGRTIVVPAGGATLSLAVNEAFGTNNTGTYSVAYASVAPNNDAFASAVALSGASHEVSGSNVGATKETGESNHAANAGGASVWWTWTAPHTGVASVSTLGSTFDTLLSVSTGSTVSALTTLASDDNSGPANTSQLTFNATAGTAYRIAVDGKNSGSGAATGNLTLHVGYAYQFSTFAGLAGAVGNTNATGSAARFSGPNDVVIDSSGHLYVGESVSHTIRKITPAGVVTTLAGSAGLSGTADGTGADARFKQPLGLALDAGGNLLVADYENHAIRRVTPNGVVTTLAGLPGTSGTTNDTGTAARFNFPVGLAVDSAGNVFVADAANHVIRKIAVGGAVTTFAGTMGTSGSTDATGTAAKFNNPYRLAFDTFGNLYVSDTFNHTIRKITSAGVVTTLAGSVGVAGVLDGVGRAAKFNKPYGVAVDAAGNVFTADYLGFTLRKITPSGAVSTIAGLGGTFGVLDGVGAAARFREPTGVALAANGHLYIADFKNETIRRGSLALAPTVASLSPSALAAGTTVTLTGSGFLGASAVSFNGIAATSFAVVSDTTLTAVFPATATAGNVTVTGPGGTSAATAAFTLAPPTPTANDRFDPGANGNVHAVVVQPDGKIVVAGDFTTLQPFGTAAAVTRTRLARLLRDGTVDPTFNPAATVNGPVAALALQSDGKIVLGGNFTSVNSTTRNRLARIHADGTLDTTFDPNANQQVFALAIQPDGQILVGGYFTTLQPNGAGSATPRTYAARLTTTGTLDPTFNVAISGADTHIHAFALQPDGAILIGGEFTTVAGASRPHLVRLLSTGALDPSFAPAFGAAVDSLALQPDGKILVGGEFTTVGAETRNHLARIHPDGTLDPSFNPGASSYSLSLAVQSDGRILVAGAFTSIAGASRTALARLLPDGTLDAAFAATANNFVRQVALQPDGSALVVGDFTVLGGHGRGRIARLLPDGSVERALIADTSGGGVGALAVQPDGKILLGGHFTTVAGQTRNAVARLNADSTLDTSFNPAPNASVVAPVVLPNGQFLIGGRFTTIAGQSRTGLARFHSDGTFDSAFNAQLADGIVNGVLLQPDGKFVVGGTFTSAGGQPRNRLARFHADGTLDTTFNPNVNGEVFGLALQPDGAIVLTGDFTTVGGVTRSRLARVASSGAVDATFDPSANGIGYLVVLQPDGKILVTGAFTTVAGASRPGVARLLPGGAIDPAFNPAAGTSGIYTLQSDGKLLVYGTFTSAAGIAATTIARLHADGSIDQTFSPATDGGTGGMTIATQPDGKTIIGGDFTTAGGQPRARLARLNSTGPTATALTATPSVVTLTRTGPLPELAWVTFEKSTDRTTWTPLGTATRIGTTANWQLTGQSLPTSTLLYLRARAAAPTGIYAASSLVEHVQQLYLPFNGPSITTPPVATSTVFGGTATFSVVATGTPAPTFQWQRNGTDLPGATNATYTVSAANQTQAGLYRVFVTNSTGSVTTTPVALDVVTRNLLNVYARAIVAPAGSIASSFTIEGTQPKTVLLIGVGGTRAVPVTPPPPDVTTPSAIPSPLTGLADPRLVLTDATGATVAQNNDWGTAANASALTAASAQVAATPGLTSTGEGAKDAALFVTLNPGTYTVTLDGADAGGGGAFLQLYDADTDNRPRLVMFTLRASVATGERVVTVGFTLGGILEKTFLFRALGEALGESPGVLIDPVIELFRGTTSLARNDDTDSLGGGTAATTAVAQVGARPITSSLDATLVQTITPGAYTMQLTPYNSNDAGTVLFELFETDAQRAATIAPVITYLTPNQQIVEGTSAYFSVVAIAKPGATYQWRKAGVPLAEATGPVLTLFNVQSADAATYDVVITSGATTITSPARTLTLLPEFHSADSDRNHRIGLIELTRIIQFFNYRVGTTRTGDYRTLAGTEDGFTLGTGAIATHHSADTNRDGRIDVLELTRVIELYNYVSGTVRTGQYHAVAGTEDGFAPGPKLTDERND